MAAISRREFFKKTGTNAAVASLLAAGVVKLRANPLGLPIGSQTYPHRIRIQCGDFAELLKDMKGIGIEVVELCNPAYNEFKLLIDGKQTRKVLDDNGMKCLSAHFTMNSLRTELQKQIDWALAIGMTQMSTASLGGKVTNGMTTLDEVKKAADEYNKIGAAAKKAGLQQALHNEGFENSKLEDGRLTYPVLMEHLDPDLVKMQFQMSSMLTVGDPIMYFTNHPGRFVSAHLQGVDVNQGMRASRAGFPPAKAAPGDAPAGGRRGGGGGANDPCAAPAAAGQAAGGAAAAGAGQAGAGRQGGGGGGGLAVGEDTVDWPKVFAAAKIGGVKNYFVEQSWDLTVKSVAYLKTLSA